MILVTPSTMRVTAVSGESVTISSMTLVRSEASASMSESTAGAREGHGADEAGEGIKVVFRVVNYVDAEMFDEMFEHVGGLTLHALADEEACFLFVLFKVVQDLPSYCFEEVLVPLGIGEAVEDITDGTVSIRHTTRPVERQKQAMKVNRPAKGRGSVGRSTRRKCWKRCQQRPKHMQTGYADAWFCKLERLTRL